MKVYLCGGIQNCTDAECRDWREAAKTVLPDTLDPMRRDYRGKENDPLVVQEIVELDKKDIDDSDALLVNHPKPSTGTDMEILYAWERDKIIISVVPKGVTPSPWLVYHSTAIVDSFTKAFELLK